MSKGSSCVAVAQRSIQSANRTASLLSLKYIYIRAAETALYIIRGIHPQLGADALCSG